MIATALILVGCGQNKTEAIGKCVVQAKNKNLSLDYHEYGSYVQFCMKSYGYNYIVNENNKTTCMGIIPPGENFEDCYEAATIGNRIRTIFE